MLDNLHLPHRQPAATACPVNLMLIPIHLLHVATAVLANILARSPLPVLIVRLVTQTSTSLLAPRVRSVLEALTVQRARLRAPDVLLVLILKLKGMMRQATASTAMPANMLLH